MVRSILSELTNTNVSNMFGIDADQDDIESALDELHDEENELEERLKKIKKGISRLESWLADFE